MTANSWSRSDGKREAAVAGRQVVDPGAWHAGDLGDSEAWVYRLSEPEIADIHSAVAGVEQRGLDIKDIRRADFPLPVFGPALDQIHDELMNGRGFAQIGGLAVGDMTRARAAAAFWGIGTYLGEAISQNAKGHVLGHVKDLGMDYDDPAARGYQTQSMMNFHADQCDILGLGCLQPAKSGGESGICSSVTLYNEMLKRRPDLAAELAWKFYWTRHGEIPPGQDPWYRQAVFSFHDGYFTARGVSSHIAKAQDLPGVPKFTPAQVEAMDMFKALARELALHVQLDKGEMLFVMNNVTLHARTGFEDWPEPERKRHLLRLWLTTHGERPLPSEFAQQVVGIRVEGVESRAPLDAE